jgi:glycosyltransferase involved in cell wall biosynthesis
MAPEAAQYHRRVLETDDRADTLPEPEAGASPEVSIVIPCLNEAEGIAHVVAEARDALRAAGLNGEIIVVDNASEDDSAALARDAGATVITEGRRGYGSAYLAGFAAARGRYVVMADADGTYPLDRLGVFMQRLRDGADLVLGSRFKGEIEPGAMPWPNRYIGNPLLTGMLNLLFGSGVSDAHCGLRAIRSDVVPQLQLSATGMEFASEMVIKAGKRRLRIDEVPIGYRVRIGDSKLSRFSDAWRHIRFMLVYSPAYLFLLPGGVAAIAGFVGLVVLGSLRKLSDNWTGVSVTFSILTILGLGVIQLGLFAERDERLEHGWKRFRLEDGLALSSVAFVVGAAITIVSFFDGIKDPRLGILGLTIVAVAFQGAFGAFFLSILGLSEHAILRRGRS